ncbi:MAG: GNAT family N-acetyltransferase [Alphaproteobacteria bacterium]|nr:GNAT family N-acetyltransferase [Alphaproteobacteria bacterium]
MITLESPRLRLRPFTEADFDAYAVMSADPEVMRYIADGSTLDRETAWRQIAMFLGHWSLRGYGLFALEPKAGGAMIGFAKLWHPKGWPGVEFGWRLARAAWGHGYATEAATVARDWAFGALGLAHLVSVIDQANARSIAVAGRLGGAFERCMSGEDDHRLIYGYRRA